MSVYIIAEIGVNHNGSIEMAFELIEQAMKAGANCVKFQTFQSKGLVTQKAEKADYQKKTNPSESQLEMLQRLELSYEEFRRIQKYCAEKKIDFLSTPFDMESIRFLDSIGIEKWKIPSGEITNLPYLASIAKTGKPVILSTGMATIDEIEEAIVILRNHGAKDIHLLHCTTSYPTPFEEANLRAIIYMKEVFQIPVGFSDHTLGIEAAIAAVALGADIIEKHFTLSKALEGPDHRTSLEPEEFSVMVSSLRNVEKALGRSQKSATVSEEKNKKVVRKSIVARKKIMCGEQFTEENLTTKRPGTGISPMKWYDIVGQYAKKDFEEDEMIEI